MITLLGADGTLSLHWALQNLFGGCCRAYFTHVALLFIATRKQDQTLARSIPWHLKDNCLCWPCQAIVICLLYVSISSIVSLLGLSSILWYRNWKGQNGKNVLQDLYHIATTKQQQKLIQEALPKVLPPRPLYQVVFSGYFFPFSPYSSQTCTHTHTHTLSSFLSILRVNSCFLTIT